MYHQRKGSTGQIIAKMENNFDNYRNEDIFSI